MIGFNYKFHGVLKEIEALKYMKYNFPRGFPLVIYSLKVQLKSSKKCKPIMVEYF